STVVSCHHADPYEIWLVIDYKGQIPEGLTTVFIFNCSITMFSKCVCVCLSRWKGNKMKAGHKSSNRGDASEGQVPSDSLLHFKASQGSSSRQSAHCSSGGECTLCTRSDT